MTYSKYACDICKVTTAEPEDKERRNLPSGWETFIFLGPPDKHNCRSSFGKDICPHCVKRPLGDILAQIRADTEQAS